MPDTHILQSAESVAPVSSPGIMGGYRSDRLGSLVVARAKAASAIGKIVKDKKATVESRKDGRSYSYSYADLADVFGAVDGALADNELVIVQTTQERATGTYLVTTLMHSSEQWVCSEIRLKSADQGPQIAGSELTYLRRYQVLAVLGIAPDTDDDGAAAQAQADARARHPRQDRPNGNGRPNVTPPPKPHHQPAEKRDPWKLEMVTGADGSPLTGRWVKNAIDILIGLPTEESRREWLAQHETELATVNAATPEYASALEQVAVTGERPRPKAAATE